MGHVPVHQHNQVEAEREVSQFGSLGPPGNADTMRAVATGDAASAGFDVTRLHWTDPPDRCLEEGRRADRWIGDYSLPPLSLLRVKSSTDQARHDVALVV
jgi:hypothetical protein